MASFDDTVTSISSTPGTNCSQERLIDGKKIAVEPPKEVPKVVLLGK